MTQQALPYENADREAFSADIDGGLKQTIVTDGYYSATIESIDFGRAKNVSPVTGERNPTARVSFLLDNLGVRVYKNFTWHSSGSQFYLKEFIVAAGAAEQGESIAWGPEWARENLPGRKVTVRTVRELYAGNMTTKVASIHPENLAPSDLDDDQSQEEQQQQVDEIAATLI